MLNNSKVPTSWKPSTLASQLQTSAFQPVPIPDQQPRCSAQRAKSKPAALAVLAVLVGEHWSIVRLVYHKLPTHLKTKLTRTFPRTSSITSIITAQRSARQQTGSVIRIRASKGLSDSLPGFEDCKKAFLLLSGDDMGRSWCSECGGGGRDTSPYRKGRWTRLTIESRNFFAVRLSKHWFQ